MDLSPRQEPAYDRSDGDQSPCDVESATTGGMYGTLGVRADLMSGLDQGNWRSRGIRLGLYNSNGDTPDILFRSDSRLFCFDEERCTMAQSGHVHVANQRAFWTASSHLPRHHHDSRRKTTTPTATMSTQASLSIPFSIVHPQQNVRLLELPPELLKIVEEKPTRQDLCVSLPNCPS